MAHQTLTIWYADGTTRDIALESGAYHAGSDLSCDFYFHPEDAVPRFEINSATPDGSVWVTARQNGVSLDGQDLPIGVATPWTSEARLKAGGVGMTVAGASDVPPKAMSAPSSSTSARLLFGISMALTIGYFALGLFEKGGNGESQTALAAPHQLLSLRDASQEVRRLTDGWPNPLKPTVTVGAKQMTIRLHEQATGNAILLAHIESFRLNPEESISVLDVPYSDEQFTALGIDALALRPRKAVITRLGTTVNIGETLGSSWQLRDISNAEITVSRGNLTKAIRLKAL